MKDGVYDVSLTGCDDDEGCSNELFQVTIANNPPTIHDVSFSTWVDDNFSFTFVMNASDPADNFTDYWDFGDGNTGEGIRPNHFYDTVGNFTVTLVVSDSGNLSSSDQSWVLVSIRTFNIAFTEHTVTIPDLLGYTEEQDGTIEQHAYPYNLTSVS